MPIDLNKLDTMEHDALKQLAVECGVKIHHKSGKEKVIEAIKNHVTQPPVQELKHQAEKPKEPVYVHTPEDVEKLVAHVKAKNPRFRTAYDDATWTFSWVNDSGKAMAEESGNLAIPPRVIKNIAEKISRGPALLRAHSTTNFEPGNAAGKSAYTNVVLA